MAERTDQGGGGESGGRRHGILPRRKTEPRESTTTRGTDRQEEVERPLAVSALRICEKILLIFVALFTLAAAGVEIVRVVELREVVLADLLLMFLYAEVIGMVAVFYLSRTTPLFYPIFIAITAVARLIVLQSKEMDPVNILYEALAILLLAGAVAVLKYFASD
jgi:protein PsiE